MIDSKFNIYINKKTIPIDDRAFNYGDGLFETVLIKNNRIIYLREHTDRLHKGCEKIYIRKPGFALIRKYARLAIGKSRNCVLKIILSRGSSDFGYQISKDIQPNLYFIKIKNNAKKLSKIEEVNIGFSKYNLAGNNHLSKIKHQNRLEQCLIANELLNTKNNYSDLVVCRNSNVIEALSSNLFFIKKMKSNYVFHTPLIDDFGINGIMRQKIIDYLKSKKFQVKIINIKQDDLQTYLACFKVNSIKGVIFIDRIGKNKFSKPEILYNVFKSFIYSY